MNTLEPTPLHLQNLMRELPPHCHHQFPPDLFHYGNIWVRLSLQLYQQTMSGHVVTVVVTEHTMLGLHQEIGVGAVEIVTLYLNPSPCSVAGRVLHLLTDAVLLHIHHHHLYHHDHHPPATNTDRRSAHAGNACMKLISSSKYTTLQSSNFFNTPHKKIYFRHFTKSRFIIELRS